MNDRILKNKLEAVEYLQRRGYKVGKSKVYADAKRGMIRMQEDGTILARDIEAYARAANLHRPMWPAVVMMSGRCFRWTPGRSMKRRFEDRDQRSEVKKRKNKKCWDAGI